MKDVLNSLATLFASASKLLAKAATLAPEIEPEVREANAAIANAAKIAAHKTKTAIEAYKNLVATESELEPETQAPSPADIMIRGSYTQAARFFYDFTSTWEYLHKIIEHDPRFYNVEFDYDTIEKVDTGTIGSVSGVLEQAKYIWLVHDGKGYMLPVLDNINDALKNENVLYYYKASTSSLCIFIP